MSMQTIVVCLSTVYAMGSVVFLLLTLMAEESGAMFVLFWLWQLFIGLPVLIVVKSSVFVVSQSEGIIIERLGKFERILNAGLNFVTPFVENPRTFDWKKVQIDANSGQHYETAVSNIRIDLREAMFNFPRQEVYTKDTVLMDINALMYYKIVDIKKAVYEVDDLASAIANTAQTQLKEVFGHMTFQESLRAQHWVNDHLKAEFKKVFDSWGITVERLEILDLVPKARTSENMKKQMIAERQRRGEFIRSEGKKAAMRLEAEGTKVVKYNMGIAEQESTRKRSEGERDAKVNLARAESSALQVLFDAIQADNASLQEYQMGQRYISMFKDIVRKVENKTLYLPYQINKMRGIMDGLPSIYGSDQISAENRATKKKGKDNFDDLN